MYCQRSENLIRSRDQAHARGQRAQNSEQNWNHSCLFPRPLTAHRDSLLRTPPDQIILHSLRKLSSLLLFKSSSLAIKSAMWIISDVSWFVSNEFPSSDRRSSDLAPSPLLFFSCRPWPCLCNTPTSSFPASGLQFAHVHPTCGQHVFSWYVILIIVFGCIHLLCFKLFQIILAMVNLTQAAKSPSWHMYMPITSHRAGDLSLTKMSAQIPWCKIC